VTSPPRAINDLGRHTEPLAGELAEALQSVLKSGWFVLGREVAALESAFGDYCGGLHCVGVANGTDALELALRALGLGPGERVLTVANAGMYSSAAILAAGATPHYVDIDPATDLLDLAALGRALETERPGALVVTHLYGRMAQMPAILGLARAAGVRVIEDCAQAHGARLAGRAAGSFGELGCFSFYPTKNLGALGDGGAVVTGDPGLAEALKSLRQYGWAGKYEATRPGGRNSRLDELQAAVLNRKLKHLDGWNRRRREIAAAYGRTIVHPLVVCPPDSGEDYVAHLYVVHVEGRDGLRAHLQAHRIPCDVHYPIPDYRQPALAGRFPGLHLPGTERACAQVLTLPCFPELTDAEVRLIAEAVNAWPG
jgi:dTDP-4-amino-4,6-dideoxygalactose transaminase